MKATADRATRREILAGRRCRIAGGRSGGDDDCPVPNSLGPRRSRRSKAPAHDDALERCGRLRLVLRNGAGISPKPRRLLAGPPLYSSRARRGPRGPHHDQSPDGPEFIRRRRPAALRHLQPSAGVLPVSSLTSKSSIGRRRSRATSNPFHVPSPTNRRSILLIRSERRFSAALISAIVSCKVLTFDPSDTIPPITTAIDPMAVT
jgi:hypothetical protein